MDRRDFLGLKTLLEKKSSLRPVFAGLEPYVGSWGSTQRNHLLKRTMFGHTKEDVVHFQNSSLDQMIDELINFEYYPLPIPVNDYNFVNENGDNVDPNVPYGQSWLGKPFDVDVEYYRTQSARGLWIRQMINQPRNIQEKMTLFWHNLLPVQFGLTFIGEMNYNYIKLLHENAMGNFRYLITEMTKNAAMLEYLNGKFNTVESPDENYAREIQELFVIGKALQDHYTEDDVREAARLLTGWRIDYSLPGYQYVFNPNDHDGGVKTFSSFYNNQQIPGIPGANGGQLELEQFIAMLLAHEEAAKHICRKVYRFFVYHDIDETTEANIILPLAQIYRDNNYEIKPVLIALFKSAHFYDEANQNSVISSPTDYWIGMMRKIKTSIPTESNLKDRYLTTNMISYLLSDMQQIPGDPPNVAGWSAYHQAPIFDKGWINNSTILKRAEFVAWWVWNGYEAPNGNIAGLNIIELTKSLNNPSDPDALIDELVDLFYGVDVSATVRFYMRSILLTGQSNPIYWTQAWTSYIDSPNDEMLLGTVLNRLKPFYILFLQKEETHLM